MPGTPAVSAQRLAIILGTTLTALVLIVVVAGVWLYKKYAGPLVKVGDERERPGTDPTWTVGRACVCAWLTQAALRVCAVPDREHV